MDTIPIINISTWMLTKVFVVFGLLIYLIFSFVLIRQVQLMRDIVMALVIGHLMFAIGVLILALIIL